MVPRKPQDVLERMAATFAENKPDLVAAYHKADEQVRIWTARRDALRRHIGNAEALAEILEVDADGGREEAEAAPVANGPQGNLLDRVFNLITERPGLNRREIATALGLKVTQVSSACQRLKEYGRLPPPDGMRRYFPKPPESMQ